MTESSDLIKEKEHIRKALKACDYPDWVIDRGSKTTPDPPPQQSSDSEPRKKFNAVIIPYIKGLSEKTRRIFKQYGVPVFFKPSNTVRQNLVRPKDPTDKENICGPIYQIKCDHCEPSYIGETERSLRSRFLEHRRPSSTTSEVSQHIHNAQPEHSISIDNANVLATDSRWLERGIKEAIYIRVNQPTLNKDGGRYNLPNLWTNFLRSHVTPCDQ